MKVSRVVLIVVALHVLVIGGIFVFEGCSRARHPSTTAENISDDMIAPNTKDTTDTASAQLPVANPPTGTSGLVPANSSTPAVATATPTPTATAIATPPAPAMRSYIVKKGDTLMKIARAEKIGIGDLARANTLNEKTAVLHIGQKLTIPQPAPVNTASASIVPIAQGTAQPPDAIAAAPAVAGATYSVKAGDSLWKIARLQNSSVAAIKKANNLTTDSLKINQKLVIPAVTADASTSVGNAGIATGSHDSWREPGSYTDNGQQVHIVNFGESPSTIAQQYHIKTDALMKANNITDAKKIQYGQKLVIPTAPPTPVVSATTTTTTPAPVATAPIAPTPTAAPAATPANAPAPRTTVPVPVN